MMAMGMSPMGMSAAMCHMDCGPKMSMHGHHLPTQVYPTSAYDRTTGHPVFSLPPILELRKEKSRDAARSRRGKENYEFYELAKMLPLPGAITSQLDKASIIRLTISYLKLKDFSSHGDPPWNRDGASPMSKTLKGQSSRRRPGVMEVYDAHQGTHILQSLDGFAFALSSDGRFLYISETVSIYLGLSQVEMTGSSIFEYVHDGDKAELSDQLGLCWPPRADSSGLGSPSAHSDDSNPSAPPPRQPTPPIEKVLLSQSLAKGYERAFCIRMKSTLTKRGVHVKSSGYRVVQLLTRIRPQFSFSITRKHPATVLGTVGVAIALPPPTISELFIDNDMFVTRLAPDLKTIYCEPRISDLMDLSSEDLTSRSLYEFCHAADLAMLRQCHNALLNKGQVLTEYYRLMNKHGGYVWVQTCATTICSAKNAEDQNIIAINYVLSGIENGGCVLNMNQLQQMDPTQLEHHNQTLADMRSEMDQYERHHSSTPETRGPTCQPVMLSDKAALHNTTGLVGEGADDVPPMIGPHENVRPVDQLNGPSSPPPLSPATSHGYKDGPDGGTTYDNYLTDKQRYDNKNSRRKNDRPRKRKRESESEEAGAIAGGGGGDGEKRHHGNEGRDDDGDGGDDSASRDMYDGNTSPHIVPPASSSSPPAKRRSPAPQDLSVKASDDVSINDSDVTMHHGGNGDKGVDIAGDNAPRATTTSAVTEATSTSGGGGGGGSGGGTATADSRDKWLSHSTTQCTLNGETHHTYTNASEGGATSSVRDLEEVMNKHLPALGTDAEQLRSTYDSNSSSIDYNYNKHKSLIQWSGSQSPSNSGETLPATNLLRSLYANRESVIRSNVYNPRPQYYNDTAAAHTLLTPPGSSGTDPYKDNVGSSSGSFSSSGSTSSNAAAAAAAAAASQLNPKSSPVGSYLPYGSGVGSGGGLSVSMPPGMSDSYNITPPASVSPQDKYYSHGSIDPCSNDVYRHYATGGAGSDSLTLPLKPHAYPLPAHTAGGYERTMNAQYAAVGSYYGHGGFYGSTAAPSPAHYHEVAKNGVWS